MGSRPLAPVLLTAAALAAAPAHATTIAPPKDLGALLRMSDAVVYADAMESWNEPGRTVPLTVTRFLVVRSIAGARLTWTFEVEELGGVVGDVGFAVAGSPRYQEGNRYLLFLGRAPDGRWRSRIMAYGLLVEDEARDLLRPLPEAAGLATVGEKGFEAPAVYRRDALLDHLQAVASGERWDASNLRDIQAFWEEIHDDPSACRFLLFQPVPPGDNLPFRYFGFETGSSLSIFATTPDQVTVDGAAAVQAAVAAWSNHNDSIIVYNYAGTRPENIDCIPDPPFPEPPITNISVGEAIFNDPCGDIPDLSGCNGTLGFGGSFFGFATPTFDNEPWHEGSGPFMVVNNGAECIGQTAFNEMMTHELGHSLGFGHHTDGNATMSTPLNDDGRGAALFPTDQACASYAYHTYRDVRLNGVAWGHIEAIENAGITQGCGSANFCSGDVVRRRELAPLLLRAELTSAYTPPVCGGSTGYSDVACGSTPFDVWIKDLKTRGITLGCNAGNTLYCPDNPVTREQLAKLLLLTMEGSAYTPPVCGGGTGYTDVACGSTPFDVWIKELRVRGITLGCNSPTNTLYCPKDALTRAELAVLLARAYALAVPTVPP